MKTIAVIGGGASGLAAAIAAGRAGNARVLVLEHKSKVGRKLLATGNGRCNLTNEYMDISCFRSETPETVRRIIARFGCAETLEFFGGLGLVTKSRDGYIYPRSAQASAVLGLLLMEARRLGIEIHTDVHISEVLPGRGGFRIRTDGREFWAERVILATGGRAAAKFGSDGSGYAIVERLGHSLVPVVPALVQLKVRGCRFAGAAGVRTEAKVTAIVDGARLAEDTGELQMTEYGISGIPVFQISRYLARALSEGKRAYVEADFIPEMEEVELCRFFAARKKGREEMEAERFLAGIFHDKLIPGLLACAGIEAHKQTGGMTGQELCRLAHGCKHVRMEIADTNGFENAQVCAGGVQLTEIDAETMESRLVPGLYLAGELLDADGICGGYNLQWAWATGCIAGRAATDAQN